MIAIIIFGPPGSGKGTQAKLLAGKLGLIHFDTGSYIRKLLYDPTFQKDKVIQRERRLNEAGKLSTPSWVLKIVTEKARKAGKLKEGIIFSGSPRTLFETIGDKKQKGLMEVLEKFYGKKNIFVFILKISPQESIKRNSKRLLCSVCQTPIISQMSDGCPFCAGKLISRRDDKKKTVSIRLKEYKERTEPIIKELKKRKYRLINIDASQLPYKIHQKILKSIPTSLD